MGNFQHTKPSAQPNRAKRWFYRLSGLAIAVIAVTVSACIPENKALPSANRQPSILQQQISPPVNQPLPPTRPAVPEVRWRLEKGNVWVATGTPPPCPEPLVLAAPVDLSLVTAVLYPGQPRGGEFKPHGGFRFDQQTDSRMTVKVPFDAQVVRASSIVLQGETQYALEFIAPCGIMYSFGHLLELSPKFQALVDNRPRPDPRSTFSTLAPPVAVKTGEPVATAVGFTAGPNVFFDWGVYDLRGKNGVQLRPAWAAKYRRTFDEYAVCWINMLSPEDAARVKALPGADSEYGSLSDYCR